MKNSDAIRNELESLTKRGVIKPEAVVAFAKNPKTALHAQFTWDNSKAAAQWRLEEARRLIRVFVVVDDSATKKEPVRAFVSLKSDRQNGGGYRSIAAVRSDAELYAELLSDALDDIRTFQSRYSRLKELKPLLGAAAAAVKVLERKVGSKERAPLQVAA